MTRASDGSDVVYACHNGRCAWRLVFADGHVVSGEADNILVAQ